MMEAQDLPVQQDLPVLPAHRVPLVIQEEQDLLARQVQPEQQDPLVPQDQPVLRETMEIQEARVQPELLAPQV